MEYKVEAVDVALRLLMLVAENPHCGLAALSEKANINKSRAFRLLYNLEQHHFLCKSEADNTYSLGSQAFVLGIAARQQNSLLQITQPYLYALNAQLDETVILRVREGNKAITIDRLYSSKAVRVHIDMGNKLPLHAGASGKLLLAHAPQVVIDNYLTQLLDTFTANTITQQDQLLQELEKIRELGYAESKGEAREHVFALAVPIYEADGQANASLSVSIPQQQIESSQQIEAIRQALIENGKLISRALGYSFY